MNILFTSYSPLGIGGAEVSMLSLAKALKKRGHNIIFASTGNYPGFKTYLYAKIRKLPFLSLKNIYFKKVLSRIIGKENIDIIHSHDSITALASLKAAKSRKIKSVTHYRDYWFICPRSSCLKPNYESCKNCSYNSLIHCSKFHRLLWDVRKLHYLHKSERILKSADAQIAISNAIANKLEERGFAHNLYVVPNSLSLVDFKKAKPLEQFSKFKTTLLYIGSLTYNKGFRFFIDAIKSFLDDNNMCFIIIGNGGLEKIIPKANNIFHFSKVPHSEIQKYYASADIVVFPSIWQEPFGRVAIETMAAGKVIIASKVGGIIDIIEHNKNGILVPPEDSGAIRDSILRLADDKELRKRISHNALQDVEKYSEGNIVSKIETIYASFFKMKK